MWRLEVGSGADWSCTTAVPSSPAHTYRRLRQSRPTGGGRSVSRLPPLPADVTHCGLRRTQPGTRNELRPLPGPDSYALLLLFDAGATDKDGQPFTITRQLRAVSVVANYGNQDENVQVNGFVFIVDMTGVTAKHMTLWSIDDMRTWNNCWQVSLNLYSQL